MRSSPDCHVCRGLEKALDHYSQPTASASASEAAGSDEKGKDARRNLMRERRKKALKNLSVPERDVLTVLSAVCKVSMSVPCLCLENVLGINNDVCMLPAGFPSCECHVAGEDHVLLLHSIRLAVMIMCSCF